MKTTKITGKGFEFDETTHKYYLDGKPLTGVTTILGVIAKPSLIQWAADEAVKHLGWFDTRYIGNQEDAARENANNIFNNLKNLSLKDFLITLSQARTQHAKRKTAAGSVGTYAHKWIETYVQAKIDEVELPKRDPVIGHMTDNFVKWAEDNKVKFLASEQRVYSRKYWYGGTFDILCEKNGQMFIVDIKTGSGIYPEHFFQMGGYQIAIEELQGFPAKINGHLVLNIKKDGTFDQREYFNLDQNKDAFLAALTLYRAIEALKI